MAGTKWYAKQGDQYGYITEQLLDENLDPVDLTAIQSVTFEMQTPGSGLPTVSDSANCEVLGNPLDGIVRYQWQPGDLDAHGQYFFEWRILFSTDRVQTFPSNGYNFIAVLRKLND